MNDDPVRMTDGQMEKCVNSQQDMSIPTSHDFGLHVIQVEEDSASGSVSNTLAMLVVSARRLVLAFHPDAS